MSSFRPRIAIVGGGPAGLATCLLLHKHGITSTIFELRPKPTKEDLAKPSGMLDLHEESGIAALKECGLFGEFLGLTGECSEAQKVSDKNGNILWSDEGELRKRPEISRHALIKLLLFHLPGDQIKWNHKLRTATSSNTSNYTEIELDFGPDGKFPFDLVIGADGAWSRVRELLTDVKPHYSGTQSITLTIRGITKKYPHLADMVGSGSFSALGDRHGVMSQRSGQDSVRIYIFLTTRNEDFPTSSGLVNQTAVAVKDHVLGDTALLGTWGPAIKELVSVACDEETSDKSVTATDIRPLYMLPVGHTWNHKKGITLIGDAAHLMCPWAGEGVNLAMWDSLLLARAVVTAQESSSKDADVASFLDALDPLMKDFEVGMEARTREYAKETVRNGKMLFGEDGAKEFAQFFRAVYE
ncbi:FAD/NAD(P)-binding domain-containing protein [Delitschia confertaspora ATCC 74209]|uniref:FAD/NAD(P)-binding domain-containing protein n=1 Tax=Delitschia confertaspora ATCC 74209 TaxID=1513339 RepID=A0A9P4JSV0_9PLEO|nr:FAD/NAD(P)-binding domain-containing protein [Delitschia confertaspora ATCC 74209]